MSLPSDLLSLFTIPLDSDYPKMLVKQVALSFHTRWAMLSRLTKSQLHTVYALWEKDSWVETLDVRTPIIPWEKIIEKNSLVIHDGMFSQFSDLEFVTQKKVKGFVGITLQNSQGEIIGFLSIFDNQPFLLESRGLEALQIVSRHVALQIELAGYHQNDTFPGKQLVAGISHELKSPLNSILGFSTLLLQMSQEKQYGVSFDEPIQLLIHSSETLKDVIDNMIDLRKFDLEGPTTKFELFDITIVIKGIMSLFKKMFQKQQNTLTYSFSNTGSLMIMTNRGALNHILICLLNTMAETIPAQGALKLMIALEDNELYCGFQETTGFLNVEKYSMHFLALIRTDHAEKGFDVFLPSNLLLAKRLIENLKGTLEVKPKNEKMILAFRIPFTQQTSDQLPREPPRSENLVQLSKDFLEKSPDILKKLQEIQHLGFWRYTVIDQKIHELTQITHDDAIQKQLRDLSQCLLQMDQTSFKSKLEHLLEQVRSVSEKKELFVNHSEEDA